MFIFYPYIPSSAIWGSKKKIEKLYFVDPKQTVAEYFWVIYFNNEKHEILQEDHFNSLKNGLFRKWELGKNLNSANILL